MEFLSFFGGVWASIAIGVFFLAMVIGCGFDRHDSEAAKWWIFVIGGAILVAMNWPIQTETFGEVSFWRTIGLYLAVGLGYSVIEVLFGVRRGRKYWNAKVAEFKKSNRSGSATEFLKFSGFMNRKTPGAKWLEIDSKTDHGAVGLEDEAIVLEPKINRVELAEHIGCWMFWWPFYAISLIIGDLLVHVFEMIADVLSMFSGRFVKWAFRDTFKF